MTVDMLANMVEDMNSHPTLANMRITTLSLLAFAGLTRSFTLGLVMSRLLREWPNIRSHVARLTNSGKEVRY